MKKIIIKKRKKKIQNGRRIWTRIPLLTTAATPYIHIYIPTYTCFACFVEKTRRFQRRTFVGIEKFKLDMRWLVYLDQFIDDFSIYQESIFGIKKFLRIQIVQLLYKNVQSFWSRKCKIKKIMNVLIFDLLIYWSTNE